MLESHSIFCLSDLASHSSAFSAADSLDWHNDDRIIKSDNAADAPLLCVIVNQGKMIEVTLVNGQLVNSYL